PLWWHGVVALTRDFGVTAPVTWRSPLPVIADTIRKLAASGMGLDGTMPPSGAQALGEVSRKLGLEEEVLRLAKLGKLQVQKEAHPNLRTLWRDRVTTPAT